MNFMNYRDEPPHKHDQNHLQHIWEPVPAPFKDSDAISRAKDAQGPVLRASQRGQLATREGPKAHDGKVATHGTTGQQTPRSTLSASLVGHCCEQQELVLVARWYRRNKATWWVTKAWQWKPGAPLGPKSERPQCPANGQMYRSKYCRDKPSVATQQTYPSTSGYKVGKHKKQTQYEQGIKALYLLAALKHSSKDLWRTSYANPQTWNPKRVISETSNPKPWKQEKSTWNSLKHLQLNDYKYYLSQITQRYHRSDS